MPKRENRALGEVAGPTLIGGNLDTKRVIRFVATLLVVAHLDHIKCRFKSEVRRPPAGERPALSACACACAKRVRY
jgi:hypothetical protein